MPNWIITPENNITDEEVDQLRLTLNNAAILAKALPGPNFAI